MICLLEQAKSCPLFPPTPFNLATSQSHSLTVPKASAFSSTAHCPWKTTLVKPPNSVTTSFAELPPSGSIFPLRLQIYSPPHSFCHAATPAILFSLFFLLPMSIAFHAFCLPHPKIRRRKKRKTHRITPLLQSLHWLKIPERIRYKITPSAINVSRALPCLACVCVWVHACERACVRACVCVLWRPLRLASWCWRLFCLWVQSLEWVTVNAKMNVSSGVSPESGSDTTALFVKCWVQTVGQL